LITWQDVEEKAELAKHEVTIMVESSTQHLLNEEEIERSSLRRLVASTFIGLGAFIDPKAMQDREEAA
jgi:hypothetical protein